MPPQTTPSNITTKNIVVNEAVTIDKLVHGGDGLGRLPDGKVFFACGVAAGDTVKGETEKKSGRLMLENIKLVSASNERVTPDCVHSDECGGCNWQHISEAAQSRWKQSIVEESFSRIGKFEAANIQPVMTKNNWQYRHTVIWNVSEEAGKAKLSYFERHSQNPVCFDECPVLATPLQKLAEYLNEQQLLLMLSQRIKARCNNAGEILLGIALKGSSESALKDFDFEALVQSFNSETSTIAGIFLMPASNKFSDDDESSTFTHLWGAEAIKETIAGQDFVLGLSHFMQGNPEVATVMIDWMKDQTIYLTEVKSILELYCGIGTMGLGLLRAEQQLIGVEGNAVAIDYAERNAAELDWSDQTHFDAIGVEAYTAVSEQSFELAICDPPRNGMKPEVLEWLNEYVSDTIIYVSCDPATQARDCLQLNQLGWQLHIIQPFDMFPQTSHVETIAVLKKVGCSEEMVCEE